MKYVSSEIDMKTMNQIGKYLLSVNKSLWGQYNSHLVKYVPKTVTTLIRTTEHARNQTGNAMSV